jgi:hypothetical protein
VIKVETSPRIGFASGALIFELAHLQNTHLRHLKHVIKGPQQMLQQLMHVKMQITINIAAAAYKCQSFTSVRKLISY